MTRVLVTGASGFVGAPCARLLAEQGIEVHGVSRSPPKNPAGVVWHEANLLEPQAPNQLVSKIQPSHLLHLAWNAVPGEYWTTPENLDWVAASLSLLKAFSEAGGERAVGVGSCAEYEWNGRVCIEGETPLSPATLYGACKAATGNIFQAFAKETGISTAWARLFHIHGPGEHPARLVPTICRGLLEGKPVRLSDGGQLRDFMDVRDCAAALVSLLFSEVEGPVNIASGQPMLIRDLALSLGDLAGAQHLLEFGALNRGGNDPDVLIADVKRLHTEVGFKSSLETEKSLASSLEFWGK